MLNRRLTLPVDDQLLARLAFASKKSGQSVAQLVRVAVEQTYVDPAILERRRKALDDIRKIRPKAVKGKIDYEEMINYGRER